MTAQSVIKIFLATCLVAGLLVAARYFQLQQLLSTALIWVKTLGYLAPIAFIGIYNLATVLLIPGSILTIGGGAIFGVLWGSIYVLIAATLGATIAFLIGRYLSRKWVIRQLEKYPKFKTIESAVSKEGLKIVFLTRLSPLFPFNLLNYAFGITGVSIGDYILGSIGMIPGTVLYVYIGSLIGDITLINTGSPPTNPILQWTIRSIGLVATIGVTIYITRIAKQALEVQINSDI
jgi:uncharacterized membrane protein YdjX (TVP38/TMEM64 family)